MKQPIRTMKNEKTSRQRKCRKRGKHRKYLAWRHSEYRLKDIMYGEVSHSFECAYFSSEKIYENENTIFHETGDGMGGGVDAGTASAIASVEAAGTVD